MKFAIFFLLAFQPNDIINQKYEVVALNQEAIVEESDMNTLLKAREKEEKDLVVLVTMDGCIPCRNLKNRLGQGKLLEALKRNHFGIVNRANPTIKPYLGGNSFPQLFKIYKDKKSGTDYITRVIGNVEDKKILEVIEKE